MYRNILVAIAIDHKHDPKESIDVARALCDEDGRVTALHVIEALPGHITQYLPEDHLERSRAEIEDELSREVGPGVSTVVIVGHAGRSIVDYADAHRCDCIVVASHRPGLQDYFLGSTASNVVRHAQCAVHVMR